MELLQLIFNGVVTGAIFSIFAMSFSIIYATTRIFHFAHGMVFTCGAYFTYLFHAVLHLNIIVAILLSIAFTSIVGMAINFVIYEPLQRKSASKLVLLVSSIGTHIVLGAIIAILFTSNVKVISAGVGTTMTIGSVHITPIQLVIIAVTLVINLLLAMFFLKTEAGLSIRALGEDSELAEIFGMSPRKLKYIIFAIGSSLAAVGATLNSLDIGTLDPHVGMEALLVCFVAIVVGGMENVPGSAVGGFIVGMLSHLSIWRIEAKWQQVIIFSFLIIVLLFKPEGLFKRQKAIT